MSEPEAYTDRDLLNQIDAEIESAFALDMLAYPSTVRVLLEGFQRKIEAQRAGQKWWEADRGTEENA